MLDVSSDQPEIVVAAHELEANRVYHAQAPGRSSPTRENLTLLLPVDGGSRFVKRILPRVTQAQLRDLLATYSVDGLRTAEQSGELAVLDIDMLEDGGQYIGVSAETSALLPAVRAHSSVLSPFASAKPSVARILIVANAASHIPF